MAVVFFEGFNYSNTDHLNIDDIHWSGNYSTKNFIKGRTNNAIEIPSRSAEDPDLSNNNILTLSGITNNFEHNTMFGIGVFISQIITNTSGNGSTSPYREHILGLFDNDREILRLNVVSLNPESTGIGLEIKQNDNTVFSGDLYNYSAPLKGYVVDNDSFVSIEGLYNFSGLSGTSAIYSLNDTFFILDQTNNSDASYLYSGLTPIYTTNDTDNSSWQWTPINIEYNPPPSVSPDFVVTNTFYNIEQRWYNQSTTRDRAYTRLVTLNNTITDNTLPIIDLCNDTTDTLITSSAVYLELYGLSNNGQINPTGNIYIKTDGRLLTPISGIQISGFYNISHINFYGTHYASGNCDANPYYVPYGLQNEYRILDDLYMSTGLALSDVNLGASVRIFRSEATSNSINQWRRNINTQTAAIISSNDDQTWIGTDYDGAIAINTYSNLPTLSNTTIDGIQIINTAKSDFYNEYFANIMLSGNNPQNGPYITLGSAKNTDKRYFVNKNSFHFQNPIDNQNWSVQDINNIQLGVIKGTVSVDCEISGGYTIRGAGDDDANGVYCYQNTTQQSVSILANNQQYYNTKNNGYYLLYTASTESWQIVNNNLVIYQAVSSPVLSSETNWTVAENGIFPPPNNTVQLLPSINPSYTYTYNSQQSIDFIP